MYVSLSIFLHKLVVHLKNLTLNKEEADEMHDTSMSIKIISLIINTKSNECSVWRHILTCYFKGWKAEH